VIAGTPADPDAEQPYVDPSFTPHNDWNMPAPRRADRDADGDAASDFTPPDHGVTSQGVAWEIVGAAQEPEAAAPPEPEPVPELKSSEPAPRAPAPIETTPEPVEKPLEPAIAASKEEAPAMEFAEARQEAPPEPPRPEEPPRKGWWQRRFGG
jgi:hypothetical protein